VYNTLSDGELSEKYSSDFNGYSNLIFDNYYKNIQVTQKSQVSSLTVNKLPAKRVTIEGKYNEVDAFFYIALIEGKERFYQIMTWTLKNKKGDYQDDMAKMIESFREL
jgi:hypothetical protein